MSQTYSYQHHSQLQNVSFVARPRQIALNSANNAKLMKIILNKNLSSLLRQFYNANLFLHFQLGRLSTFFVSINISKRI